MATVTTGRSRSNLALFKGGLRGSLRGWHTALGSYPVVPTPAQGTAMGKTRARGPQLHVNSRKPLLLCAPQFPCRSRAWALPALGTLQVPLSSLGCSGSQSQAPAQYLWATKS